MKAQTQELINRTTQIQNEKYDILVLFDVFPGNSSIIFSQELNVKSCITEGFIDRFQLKPDELNALRTTGNGFLHPVKKVVCVEFQRSFAFFSPSNSSMYSNESNRYIKIVNYCYEQINKQLD